MAENVHQNLEGMLPELEEMERLGIFSREEIRSIIKKRTDFEYHLQKRIVKKPDFLRYMQYEMNLDLLRKKRKLRLGLKKTTTGDFAMIRRLNLLFQKSVKKFVGDTKLWLQYIEFCKNTGSTKILGKVFAQLLQYHPHKPSFWIMAAKWEFEENKNVPAARIILQRGIRMNPESTQLWLEYFRMELLHVDKVLKRRKVLGLAKMEESDENEPSTDEFLAGRVAEIVYQKAIEAIPDDIDFRVSFLRIYQLFDNTTGSRDKVYESIRRDFSNSEECWDILARRSVEELTSEGKRKSTKITESEWENAEESRTKVYEEAVKTLQTERMWECYITCNLEELEGTPHSTADKIVSNTVNLCKRAEESNLMSEEMYKIWASLHLMTGDSSQAMAVYKKAVKRHAQCVLLWTEYLRLRILSQESQDTIEKGFWRALDAISSTDSLPLWQLFVDWGLTVELDSLTSVFERSLESCSEVAIVMKERYIDWAALTKGIKKARKLYTKLCTSRPVDVSLFKKCITLEQSQVNSSIKHLRALFDTMVDRFGSTESDCWLEYINLELTHPDGQPENAGKLHWRAMRTLSGVETTNFVTKYSLLQAGNL